MSASKNYEREECERCSTYFEGFVDVSFALYTQLDVVKGFRARRGVIHVFALYVRDHFTGK